LAAVKKCMVAVSTTGPLVELWTGYSTVLCIIEKLLRKVSSLGDETFVCRLISLRRF
jgi:hypothetical protein